MEYPSQTAIRAHPALVSLVAALICLWTLPAYAVNFTSAGGYLFDVQDLSGGALGDGTDDAYDRCYSLEINGTQYQPGVRGAVEGRMVTMGQMSIGALRVHRTAHVPDESGRDYARYTDFIENTDIQPVTVTVRYFGNLGSDGSTSVWGSSSGDTLVSIEDNWFGTDDSDGSGDPSLAHVFFNDRGSVRPTHQGLSGDDIEAIFSVEIGPGESVAFVVFAFQGPNQEAVRRQVDALGMDPGGAFGGLEPNEQAQIVNWSNLGGIWTTDAEDLLGGGIGDEGSDEIRTRLIYQAQLRLATRDVEGRMEEAIEIAGQLGGGLSQQEGNTVVVRVPADRFHEALERFEALGDVLSRRVTVQGISARVRDLRTRLRSAMDIRNRLMVLLDRTSNATEAVALQREIERINGGIELLESRIRELEEQIRLSTFTITFQSTLPQPELQHFERPVLPFPWLDELGLENLLDVHR